MVQSTHDILNMITVVYKHRYIIHPIYTRLISNPSRIRGVHLCYPVIAIAAVCVWGFISSARAASAAGIPFLASSNPKAPFFASVAAQHDGPFCPPANGVSVVPLFLVGLSHSQFTQNHKSWHPDVYAVLLCTSVDGISERFVFEASLT